MLLPNQPGLMFIVSCAQSPRGTESEELDAFLDVVVKHLMKRACQQIVWLVGTDQWESLSHEDRAMIKESMPQAFSNKS